MKYEVTDLVYAFRPAGAVGNWWQMQTVLDSFEADDEDTALDTLAAACEVVQAADEEADLNVYGRKGYRLVATRDDGESRIALWEKE